MKQFSADVTPLNSGVNRLGNVVGTRREFF